MHLLFHFLMLTYYLLVLKAIFTHLSNVEQELHQCFTCFHSGQRSRSTGTVCWQPSRTSLANTQIQGETAVAVAVVATSTPRQPRSEEASPPAMREAMARMTSNFEDRSVQSKKRPAKTRSTKQGVSDAASMVHGARCMDADLDGVEVLELDDEQCSVQKPVASGRVLPKWAPAKAKSSSVPPSNLFQEFGYVK